MHPVRGYRPDGGRIQFGWPIRERRHVYVEAEHHAICEPPDGGPRRDITPSGMTAAGSPSLPQLTGGFGPLPVTSQEPTQWTSELGQSLQFIGTNAAPFLGN
jgi:hypothetical protein